MDESILLTLFFAYGFIMIGVNFVVCHPTATGCFLSSSSSSCEEGDWGGFLSKGCCGADFDGYLYSMGKHANETGQLFLNSTEQRECLNSMKVFEEDVFSCGIEKLTSGTGSGGCSDFSVFDVIEKLGDEFRSLEENCKFTSPDGGWNGSCSSCLRSWQDIGGIHSSLKDEADICRFAVLVSLLSSRIEDEPWFGKICTCLREQDFHNLGHSRLESDTQSTPKSKT